MLYRTADNDRNLKNSLYNLAINNQYEEIVNISKKLGEQISKDYEGKKPLLVGLLKGSVPFMAELMKHIDIEMEIDFDEVINRTRIYFV